MFKRVSIFSTLTALLSLNAQATTSFVHTTQFKLDGARADSYQLEQSVVSEESPQATFWSGTSGREDSDTGNSWQVCEAGLHFAKLFTLSARITNLKTLNSESMTKIIGGRMKNSQMPESACAKAALLPDVFPDFAITQDDSNDLTMFEFKSEKLKISVLPNSYRILLSSIFGKDFNAKRIGGTLQYSIPTLNFETLFNSKNLDLDAFEPDAKFESIYMFECDVPEKCGWNYPGLIPHSNFFN